LLEWIILVAAADFDFPGVVTRVVSRCNSSNECGEENERELHGGAIGFCWCFKFSIALRSWNVDGELKSEN
jgi:hypothetical protein